MDRTITHSCGHTERHLVGGEWISDRDRQAARLARRKCTSCATEAKGSAAVRIQAVACEQIGSVQLPLLCGSPRQVAWAETIRVQQLAALARVVPDVVAHVAGVDDARWWIEHRSDTAAQLAALVAVPVDLPAGAVPHRLV